MVMVKPSVQVVAMSMVMTPEAVAGSVWVNVVDEKGCPGDAAMLYVVLFKVESPPVMEVTEPVSGRLKSFSIVQTIWNPVPSGLAQLAEAEMMLSWAKAGPRERHQPKTTARAEARPPSMTASHTSGVANPPLCVNPPKRDQTGRTPPVRLAKLGTSKLGPTLLDRTAQYINRHTTCVIPSGSRWHIWSAHRGPPRVPGASTVSDEHDSMRRSSLEDRESLNLPPLKGSVGRLGQYLDPNGPDSNPNEW